MNRPNNMSRRGFIRNVLGISTAIILPAPMSVWPDKAHIGVVSLLRDLSPEDLERAAVSMNEFIRYRLNTLRPFAPIDPLPADLQHILTPSTRDSINT